MRLGKTATYLHKSGHSVTVLTERNPPYPQDLPLEFPTDQIIRTRWCNVNAAPRAIKSFLGSLKKTVRPTPVSGKAFGGNAINTPEAEVVNNKKPFIVQFINAVMNFPDSRIGWLPAAIWSGRRQMRRLQPDIIFASGPPFTTLLVGYLLSRGTGTPLIVELRDRWSDDPYYPPPQFELKWRQWLENKILTHARGITTVSEPWAKSYREKYQKPVEVIYNGFDPEDFLVSTGQGNPDHQKVRIVYTGGIYPGRRDPSALFDAIGRDNDLKSNIRIDFFGTQEDHVLPLAQRFGVSDVVFVHSRISHAEALEQQCAADVLLMMQWNDPKEQGNVPGKFFEYLAARRPMLIMGLEDGVPATLARDRGIGFCANTVPEIADILKGWVDTKHRDGSIAPVSEDALLGFSRAEQVAKLEAFLKKMCRNDSK